MTKGVSMLTYLSETVRRLTKELAEERAECMEQVKLVVMFADRCERLRAEVVRLRAERDHAQVQADHLAKRLIEEARREH